VSAPSSPEGSAASRLRRKIELVMPALRAASHRFLTYPRPDMAYREYLVTSHAVVRASVPLMEAALARAQSMAHDDPVSARLVGYLPEHILEEVDHDAWILEDLKLIGVDRSSVLERPPSHRVAALVGAQYYWIYHYHPAALLGYMAVLEGSPPSLTSIEQLIERTSFDRRAFRTILEHAVIDNCHGEDLFRLVDELALSAPLSNLLGLSSMHTVVAMAAVIDEFIGRCP
jgi:Iron-containing redox enzyme